MKQYRITGIAWNAETYTIEVADHRTHSDTDGVIYVETVFFNGVEIPFDLHEGNNQFEKDMYNVAHRAIADFHANERDSSIPISQIYNEENWLTVDEIKPSVKQDEINLLNQVEHTLSQFNVTKGVATKLNGSGALLDYGQAGNL